MGSDLDRSWCHFHTHVKLFWKQRMAPWTSVAAYACAWRSVHGSMGCDQGSFIILVMWWWLQLMSDSLPIVPRTFHLALVSTAWTLWRYFAEFSLNFYAVCCKRTLPTTLWSCASLVNQKKISFSISMFINVPSRSITISFCPVPSFAIFSHNLPQSPLSVMLSVWRKLGVVFPQELMVTMSWLKTLMIFLSFLSSIKNITNSCYIPVGMHLCFKIYHITNHHLELTSNYSFSDNLPFPTFSPLYPQAIPISQSFMAFKFCPHIHSDW